jgi:hypothetical protein
VTRVGVRRPARRAPDVAFATNQPGSGPEEPLARNRRERLDQRECFQVRNRFDFFGKESPLRFQARHFVLFLPDLAGELFISRTI